MSIKAVVFDLGGVLEMTEDDTWPEVWIRSWEDRLGLTAGAFLEGLARHEPVGNAATGELSEPRMREIYADVLGLDEQQADELMAEMWDAYCGELDRDLYDFFASLGADYKLAIVSNSADGARREEGRRFGFPDLVDELVYSHEVGLAKPDPAIYALTTERLGVQPDEVVFLDDRLDNVEAANAFGWLGVVHTDTASSIDAIKQILADRTRPGR
ncbi:MAG: hypothetical protein AVDCRST_MAG72-2025 [uncultured Nocardioidaceae bacterium]|uniref:Hydrolase, haloacid dehalogenase-like family n=1 Tax=uncultured Nocardioidaceae bacterium TaxID=253824 RepID=A0A6J4MGD4_9ACTN|nr:MAG: hypothetical protein AVDCRST_MAG72-2025 [uncultured Nocardioidaceae bacterium]